MIVKTGRIEFVNGGWISFDEACPNHQDMILNMRVAHDFMQREFGITVDVGWQIDSFGHSGGAAKLYAEMDYRALFIVRIDYQEKNYFKDNKKIEF